MPFQILILDIFQIHMLCIDLESQNKSLALVANDLRSLELVLFDVA